MALSGIDYQLVSTVAASIAAVAAVVALIFAWKTLREAGATTVAQRDTVRATQTLTDRLEDLLSETQVMRDVEGLARVAQQVQEVVALMHRVPGVDSGAAGSARSDSAPWRELERGQRLLAAYLSALSTRGLATCGTIATIVDVRWADVEKLHLAANDEIQHAMAQAQAGFLRTDPSSHSFGHLSHLEQLKRLEAMSLGTGRPTIAGRGGAQEPNVRGDGR